MANLSSKFVTSFSELYFRPTVLSAAELANPSSWFAVTGTNPTAKTFTVTATVTTAEAGNLVIRYTNVVTGRINTVLAAVGAGDTVAAIAGSIKTAVSADSDITTGTVAGGAFTATLLAAAGNSSIEVEDAVAGVTVSIIQAQAFVGGVGATLLIPNVAEIGSLSNEASVIETPTFGDAFKGKLRGQLDAGQLDAQLYWAPRNSTHLAMREAATLGTACSFGIKWKSDAVGTTAEYVIFDGFLSSFGIDSTFDDVAKASSTMIVDGALTFADDS
tara:strand:+ start:234 stop:1055 length:822 start_codon:yes stop_codon:yes gene_type:complete